MEHVSRAQHLAPARTRTRVVQVGAQCTDHWTTGQSHGVCVPMVQLTTHVISSTLYSHMVVWSYIQIFSAWWVTTILYNYGAMLCKLCYKLLTCSYLVTGMGNEESKTFWTELVNCQLKIKNLLIRTSSWYFKVALESLRIV